MSDYKSKIELQIRYRDLDTLGHVNNAVYLSYFELGRIDFIRNSLWEFDAGKVNFVLAHVEVDFRKPLHIDDPAELVTYISETGNTSFTFTHTIRDTRDGSIFCTGRTVAVLLSPEERKPQKLPDAFRELVYTGD